MPNCGCSPSGYPTKNNECCTDVAELTRFAYSSAQSAFANAQNAEQSAEDAATTLANAVLKTGSTMTGTLTVMANILANSNTSQIGYGLGAGGTITQLASKSTAVTLNRPCGQITLNNAALNASTTVSFILNNSTIAAGDVLVLNHISGGTIGSYLLNAQSAAGNATINVRNATSGSLSEAIVIAFAVIKAQTS